ncbi:MAG: hypothetical protein ACKV2O_06565 [Acidimicrobiales bacterium]
MRKATLTAGLVMVLAVAVAGCGEGAPPAGLGTESGQARTPGNGAIAEQARSGPGERLLSCGHGLPFPPAAISGPVISADDPDPLFVAYRAFVGPSWEPGALRVLARTDGEALLSEAHRPGFEPDIGFAPFDSWHFALEGSQWRYTGNGSCRLQAFVDGQPADPWELEPSFPAPAPQSTTLHVLVHEQDCASGRPATGRVREPAITYGADRVDIAITTDRAPGGQDCPSNPATPLIIELSEPLGDRELFDAGREPIAPPGPVQG